MSSAPAWLAQQRARLPLCLQTEVTQIWQEFAAQAMAEGQDPAWFDRLEALSYVWACSEFAARTCALFPGVLQELHTTGELYRAYAQDELKARLIAATAEIHDEAQLKTGLRQLRRREMLRIAWRDLTGLADLREVMTTLSDLADACVDTALAKVYAAAVAKHGEPVNENNRKPARMVVLGLGKLGGRELNFSSDIDLIFAYTEDGETPSGVSNHEFFTRIGRTLVNVLSEATVDGFVFRMDMRLRPNGESGPLALGFDAMEHYYQTHGREWERYALIKARVVAGDRQAGEELLARLKPFVYRKYLDYGAIAAIRALKETINRELSRTGMQEHIKLGPGGIREIEFIGQIFQLIRGGREPVLQERGIRSVLASLAAKAYLTQPAAAELDAAYVFLRRVEHRLQMVADRQTHTLPPEACEQSRLALAMGFSDWAAFAAELHRHRSKVHEHFEQVFTVPQSEPASGDIRGLAGVWLDTLDEEVADQVLRAAGFVEPPAARDLLRGLRAGSAYSAFSSHGRERMDRLIPLLLAAAGSMPTPLLALERLVKLLEAIGRRSAYLALLIENPVALSQLVKLCGASAWIAGWLSQHPVLLDELLDPAALYAPLTRAGLESELRERLAQLPPEDLEAQMEALREFRHGHVLRVAAANIGSGLPPETVRLHLCRIAEVVLQESLLIASATLVKKHGHPACRRGTELLHPGFAVIAYGKLGSLELGYTSDLDIIFLHHACDEDGATDGGKGLPNEMFFSRLGQRLIHLLTARTPAGVLYNVDMRLRPSGRSGPLVTNLAAFRNYQRSRAWVWEHQALVRARAVAGNPEVCKEFTHIRREILCLRRDPEELRREVKQMRSRMQAAQPAPAAGLFDLKQDRGGIVDIEFMVQYWVLRFAADYPELTNHTDNIHILADLVEFGLLTEAHRQTLVEAYRRYLSIEQHLRLMEHRPWEERVELGDEPDKIAQIWHEVFRGKHYVDG